MQVRICKNTIDGRPGLMPTSDLMIIWPWRLSHACLPHRTQCKCKRVSHATVMQEESNQDTMLQQSGAARGNEQRQGQAASQAEMSADAAKLRIMQHARKVNV